MEKNQVCRILVCDEYGSINLISLLSWEQSRLTPVCMCATARVGVHAQRTRSHWQEVSQGKVSGRRPSKKCVSQLSSSVMAALRVSVCSCLVLPKREVIIYQHLRHESRRVRPTFSSVNSDVRERLFVYLAQIVEFVSCDVNVLINYHLAFPWIGCIPSRSDVRQLRTAWSLLKFDPLSFSQDFSMPHFFSSFFWEK